MNKKTNLDFVSIQVNDLQASSEFYQNLIGFQPNQDQFNPEALVFSDKKGSIFAIRKQMKDLSKVPNKGAGIALWFAVSDIKTLYKKIKDSKYTILQSPKPSPFGDTIIVEDPDGYNITFHEYS